MRPKLQCGFTLIEALVALLVLSIGMLGVAAMQLKALQGAHAAYQRSIASLAAQDAQERLWAEMASSGTITCPTNVNAIQTAWRSQWEDYFPGFGDDSNGSVASTLSPGALGCEFNIDVVWDETRFGDDEESFSYTVRLPGNTP